MKYVLILALLSPLAHAGDQWICTEEGIQHSGNVWSACGVGQGMDEGAARQKALYGAINEFNTLCEMNSSCKDHDKSIEPKRTTCGQTNESTVIPGVMQWKCYRMIQVTVN